MYLSNQSPTYVCIVRCSYQQARPRIYVWNHTYNPWALPTAWMPHCSLALKHLVSFRNEEAVQGRGMTFGKQRGTVHPPCKVLPSFNSAIKSQNLQPGRNRRLVANQPAKVTFPWGVNKTAEKASRTEKQGLQPASVPASRAAPDVGRNSSVVRAHSRSCQDGISTFLSAVPSL